MTAQILDGIAVAKQIKDELRIRVANLQSRGKTPGLGTILVGDDPGSVRYVAGKHRDCEEVGILSIREDLPDTATESEIFQAIERLNRNPHCTGYIVQLPIPAGVNTNSLLEAVDPNKDADGIHPVNLGKIVLRVNGPIASPIPCTPLGIIELLTRNGIDLNGKHVVVLGRGTTVGRSIGLLLTRKSVNATVTLTHTGTRNLEALVREADVVVAAVGKSHFVQAHWIKPGAVVLDVGVSRTVDEITGKAKILGDVAPDVWEVASWVSPNPGGVGPMTRAMLLENVVRAAEL